MYFSKILNRSFQFESNVRKCAFLQKRHSMFGNFRVNFQKREKQFKTSSVKQTISRPVFYFCLFLLNRNLFHWPCQFSVFLIKLFLQNQRHLKMKPSLSKNDKFLFVLELQSQKSGRVRNKVERKGNEPHFLQLSSHSCSIANTSKYSHQSKFDAESTVELFIPNFQYFCKLCQLKNGQSREFDIIYVMKKLT